MTLSQALGQVAGRADLFLVRSTGKVLRVTDRFSIEDWKTGKAHNFVPTYSDLVTDEWQVVTPDQLRKRLGDDAAA
jgi:hypothetical protein